MFGIDQISWGQFGGFILLVVFLWYLSVILNAFSQQRKRNHRSLFEEADTGTSPLFPDELKPVAVSSVNLPSRLIPFPWESDLPLTVSFYEETGLDEGYAISCFSRPGDPRLPAILEQVQFQQ